MDMKEAYFYNKVEDSNVRCTLCPHNCLIKQEATGICGVRKNIDGKLYSLNYLKVSGFALDPIEKKPLYHFYPGTNILSFGSFGCNFSCSFCQNYHIAKEVPKTRQVTISEMMETLKTLGDNIGIAYTYNEPTVFYEFMYDMAREVHNNGYKNVVVSNGYINRDALEMLIPYIDSFNIDLKSFSNEFYKNICAGRLSPVMETIKNIGGRAHLEITLLLIDGLNTDEEELDEMFRWLASIDKDIVLHLSRYHPSYKMNRPATKISSLLNAQMHAKEHLNYVYVGNVSNLNNDTFCYNCGEKVIERTSYIIKSTLDKNKCPKCKHELPIINT